MLGTALLYALLGWAALGLAVPPGHASPIYPGAGIALGSVLVFGRRMLWGVALGAVLANVGPALMRPGSIGASLWVFALIVGLGASLQAAVGAWLVRRYIKQPLTLSEPRDIALFSALAAVLASMVSATIGVGTLTLLGLQPPSTALLNWWVWGTGDTLGVLLATPVVLSWLGHPRSEWVHRRWSIGLTLCVATVLMALGIRQINAWERTHVRTSFEQDASAMAANMAAQLQYPLHALEAMRGVYIASDVVTPDEFQRASAAWLAPKHYLRSFGFGTIELAPGPDASGASKSAPPITVQLVEPGPERQPRKGVDLRGDPITRETLEEAISTGLAVATREPTGALDTRQAAREIAVFQAIYRGNPSSPAERKASLLGVVFITLRPDMLLTELHQGQPDFLHFCLFDNPSPEQATRLAGPGACELRNASVLTHQQQVRFANRLWVVQVSAHPDALPISRERNVMLFSVVGLLATAMLGALLLTVTGRTRRIEAAVNERTAALQNEVAHHQLTEASLRASEQRFRNILNHVPIGVVYTDLEGRVQQVNPRFCELTGYTESELLSTRVSTLIHPDDRLDDVELTHQLVLGKIPMYRRQCRYVTRDGRVLWVQAVVSALRDADGQASRIVAAVEDITEHLRLEDAERAREVAEAANLAKSEFLSRMSHELRTPLNAMLGFAQLLELDQTHPLPDAHRPWVMQIQSAGWHLLDMINDVLDLSRIDAGTLLLLPQSLDLRDMLAATTPLLEGAAAKRHVTITQALSPHAAHVLGDATRVKQIFTNLLSNAVKYNVEGGRVHIATRRATNELVEITITDTGLGMSPEQQAMLFQPFNRLGRERSSHEGTGIGLVISRRLAELMGGSLSVSSEAGQGSSFTITLPTALAPLTETVTEAQPSAPSTYHQRIVHYVEDNETNVEVMRGILASRPQVRLDVSINGLDGLAAIRADMPDLVLLDMHLPDISGMELLLHLKADPATASIPVVAVSADALSSQIDAARQAGAMRYLTKPVNVSELLALIDGVMGDSETRFG